MRLIAWNANFNNRRRTLEQTAALLAPLHADIYVLSEVPPPHLDIAVDAVNGLHNVPEVIHGA